MGLNNFKKAHKQCPAENNAIASNAAENNDSNDGGEQGNERTNADNDMFGSANSDVHNDSSNANNDGGSLSFSNDNDEFNMSDEEDDTLVARENDQIEYNSPTERTPVSSLFPNNSASRIYFGDNIDCNNEDSPKKGRGVRGMVHRALNDTKPDEALQGQFESSEFTLLMFQLMGLLLAMSVGEKQKIMVFVYGLFAFVTRSVGNSLQRRGIHASVAMPSFPITRSDATRMCVSTQNQSSLWAQIPSETVHTLDDGSHVYISLDELIDHIMAHGAPISWMQDDTNQDSKVQAGINGCEAAKEMLERQKHAVKTKNEWDPNKTHYGYLTLWSDAFITAWVKQKDNSVWCMTVTVAPPNDNDRSEYHTHCIALGPKGSHTKVVECFLKELAEIRKGKWRYYSHEKRWVYTSFDCLVYLSDKPERADITQTLAHSGRTAKRSRYAALVGPELLSSCDQCFAKMINQASSDDWSGDTENTCSPCCKCCNWDYSTNLDGDAWTTSGKISEAYREKDKSTGQYKTTYPTTVSQGNVLPIPENRPVPNTSFIRPHEQTFEWLEQGANLTLQELTVNRKTSKNPTGWTSKHAENYLNSMGINEKTINFIKEQATMQRGASKRSREESKMNDDDHGSSNDDIEANNDENDDGNIIPLLWRSGYDLRMFIDCPMHLLFLGVVGTILEVAATYMKKYNKETSFNTHINAFLKDIIGFRLDYCVLKKLPRKNWISENHVALARIIPFVFGQYVLNFSKEGDMHDLSEEERWLQRLVNSAFVMISLLMTRENVETTRLNTHIKIFLTCCQRFSKCSGDNTASNDNNDNDNANHDPFWFGKANFFSLLNLPDQIKRFGSLRWYWDGK
jgi:hypothetical protein